MGRVVLLLIVALLGHDLLMATPAVARHGAAPPHVMASDPGEQLGHARQADHDTRQHGNGSDGAAECRAGRDVRLTASESFLFTEASTPHPVEAAGVVQDERLVVPADHAPPTRPPRLLLALLQVLRV